MLRNLMYLCSSFFILLVFACSSGEYEKDTRNFESYLGKYFDESFTKKSQVFFIIPSIGCSGCKKTVLNYLQQTNKDVNVVVVSQIDGLFPGNVFVLYDSLKKIDVLDIDIASSSMLITQNKKIVFEIELNYENTDSIDFYIDKYK